MNHTMTEMNASNARKDMALKAMGHAVNAEKMNGVTGAQNAKQALQDVRSVREENTHVCNARRRMDLLF